MTSEEIQKKGYEVIYGDTDSIAFQVKEHSPKQVKDFLKYLLLQRVILTYFYH